MANQYNQYSRLHYFYSLRTLSCLIIFIIFLQGPIIVNAQAKQYESVIGLTNNNNNIRSSSTTSTISNNDNADYDVDSEFYADGDGDEGASSSSSSSTVKYQSQGKVTPNPSPHIPAETEDVDTNEHEGGSDAYSYDENSGNETTNPDDSEVFGDTMSNNPSDMNSINPDSNNRKGSDLASTSRIPFISSNLWRDLFTKPGILVGIIGGVVIGMLSAILLVMFIIYRMRKKDEGSYALEEGPRKSPSHAYTRVSSREFFA